MNDAKIIQVIENVIHDFVAEPKCKDHLRRGRVERTFTADLANKLKPFFEKDSISVDPFYNKHNNAAKHLGIDKKVIELDVAIHERGTDENNLVAIELEANNRPKRDDVWKIEGLTKPLGGYGYKLGLFLVFGIEDQAGTIHCIEWYKYGKLLQDI